MGKVYKARHLDLDRLAALKVIRQEYSQRDDIVARFKREAAVCSALHHQNVIKLFDYGEENGVLFYAMEYLDKADDLDDYLIDHGPMSLPVLIKTAKQLCSAFSHLHENGIVHRDVKPANIMIGKDGHVTLMDFGLVHRVEGTALTKEGKAIGTPKYMAPEQLMGEKADHRTDIFQLGLVLYEIATGEAAFKGKDVYAIAHAVLKEAPQRPSTIIPTLSPDFDGIIIKCLHKNRDDRFQSAGELARALDELTKPRQKRKKNKDLKATAIHSKLSNSTIKPPVAREHSHALLAGSCLAIILTIFAISSLVFSEEKQYSSTQLTLAEDMGAIIVTWISQEPYPSAIEVIEIDDKGLVAGKPELVSGDKSARLKHKLIARKLDAGKRYSIAVVYPNGKRSLARIGSPLKAKELVLARWTTSYPSLHSHLVQWETNVPCRCIVSYKRKGKKLQKVLSAKARRNHLFRIDDLGEEEVVADVKVHLAAVSQEQTIPWGDVQGVVKFARQVTKRLSEFQIRPLMDRLKKVIRTLPKQGRESCVNTIKTQLLDKTEEWLLIKENRALLREMFTSKNLSLNEVKQPLYASLRKMEMIDSLLDWQRLPRITELGTVYSPFVTISWSSKRPEGDAVQLLTLGQIDASFLPTNYEQEGQDGSISQGLLSIYGTHRSGQEREVTCSKTLADLQGQNTVRLIARVRNLTPEAFLRVYINDSYFVDLYNNRENAPPTRWLAGYKPEMGETEEYLASVNYICARIPAKMLKKGKNDFKVGFRCIPTVGSVHVMQLRELSLYY